ncbi:MAG: hypothetical protein QNJ15_04660 [Erythrobacter sp.]|nr:hypothetical protein [Erythrobacter sp.]
MADGTILLEQPVPEGSLQATNFFNGRLLEGSDFTREQNARAQADERLGQAMGAGVAFGLTLKEGLEMVAEDGENSLGRPIIVEPGLAVNALGQAMRLSSRQQVQLTRPPAANDGTLASGCGPFGACSALGTGTYVAGQGLYILTIAPAQMRSGRAPSNGISGAAVSCNIDQVIETVQFRLLEVPASLYNFLPATADDFRNQIAYRCFGEGVKADWVTHLLARGPRGNDLVQDMAANGLGEQEVPLGILAYTGADTIMFIDAWAVRRPLVQQDSGDRIGSLVEPYRLANGMAMLRQFQDHLATEVGAPVSLGDVRARSHFPYLPPAGVLPNFSEEQALEFFGGMTIRGPVHINGPQVEPLLRESQSAPAIRSADNEVVWLYAVAANRMAGAVAAGDPDTADPYLIFARGDLAYRGNARFNLHRWDYANFALT